MARVTAEENHGPRRKLRWIRHLLRRRGRPLTGLEAFNLIELKRGADPMRWHSRHGVWPEAGPSSTAPARDAEGANPGGD